MASVSEIWVKINSDITGLQRGLATSSTELKAFSSTSARASAETAAAGAKMKTSFSGIGSAVKAAAPAFVAIGALAVAGIVKGIDATVEWAAEVRSLQRVTGQTAESASALAAAAAQLGIPVNQLNIGFGLLSKNIINNATNLTKYGIATRDASGQLKPFDEVLATVSDKFATLPKGPEQAAFAMNVFGRSGKALIPILQRGSAGLAELEAHAKAAGLVMSQQDVDAAKNLSIAQRQLSEAFKGASISIGKAFIPAATAVVKVVTGVVEVFTRIPQPVKTAAFSIAALTGALAALELVVGFFSSTWTKALALIGVGSAAEEKAAADATLATAAFTGQTASVAALTASIDALTVAVGGALPAAEGKAIATGTVWEAQLAELNATAKATTASTSSVGSSFAGFATKAGPASAVLGAIAVAVGFVTIQMRDAKAAVDQFGTSVQSKLGQLAQGGDFAKAVKRLAATPLPTQALPGSIALGGGLFQQTQDIKAAQQALDEWRQSQLLAASSSEKLTTSIRGTLKSVEDLQTPVKDVSGLISTLDASATKATGGLDQLSKVSGQDFGSIRDDLLKAINDPKTTVAQLPAIFGAALSKTKEQMNAWHDSIVSNFGGASAAMSQFLGQAAGKGPNKVSFDDLTQSLKTTQAQLHTWSQDFATILRESGGKAKTFLQDMSANGLQSVGILQVVAEQPKKIRDEFLKNYNDVNKSTDTIATQITNAFGKAADRIVLQLKNIVRAIQGLPPIKPKTDTSALDALIAKLRLAATLAFQVSQGNKPGTGPVSPRQAPHGGGLITAAGKMHAGGAVKRMHVGGLAANEVPLIAQVGEFVVQKRAVDHLGLSTMRRINTMHSGGAVPPGTSSTEPMGLTKREITEAFREALRAEREPQKLYVDRRRFGRDLDEAVLNDGRW